ncbi:MAG: GxxExxY protein, partial [Verrucomicrobiota bacterium]
HKFHRHGHIEKIYENALSNRLKKDGLNVLQQHPLNVLDEDGTILGNFYADLLVEKNIVIEIKACKILTEEHTSQLMGYLRASRIKHGILLNFGSPRLQIRKYTMTTV